MSNTDRFVRGIRLFDRMYRPPKPPIEDRFGVPAERLLEGITAKERQTILLCAVYFSANYHRLNRPERVSSGDVFRDALEEGLDVPSAQVRVAETARVDPRYIGGDLTADPMRAELFPDLTDEEMIRFCEDFNSYLTVVRNSFRRAGVYVYDLPVDTFVAVMASEILTIQAERVEIPWFGIAGREVEKRGLIRKIVAGIAEPS